MYLVTNDNSKYTHLSSQLSSAISTANDMSALHNEPFSVIRQSDGYIAYSTDDAPALQMYEVLTEEMYINRTRGFAADVNHPSVYFDIDGTLSYWHTDAKGLIYPDEVLSPEFHYFRNLEPHPFVVELAKKLVADGIDVCVMSAAAKDTIRDKFEWIKEYCPFVRDDNIFFCPLGADKSRFVKGNAKISVLIDDYNKNLEEWKGIPIKSINSINSENKNINCIHAHYAETNPPVWEEEMDKAVDLVKQAIQEKSKDVQAPLANTDAEIDRD